MRGAGIQAGSEITEVERDLAFTSVNESRRHSSWFGNYGSRASFGGYFGKREEPAVKLVRKLRK